MVVLARRAALLALSCAAAWAQNGVPETAPKFETPGSIVRYHESDWTLVRRTQATFDASAPPFDIALLKSLSSTDEGGAGQPGYDVELVILQGAKVSYDYVRQGVDPGYNPTRFYMDDALDIGDVTGDGIPEVRFHSGV